MSSAESTPPSEHESRHPCDEKCDDWYEVGKDGGRGRFGGASSEVRRYNCSVVDESRSSLAGLAARCVSFYQ